jgi:hypothetical protein
VGLCLGGRGWGVLFDDVVATFEDYEDHERYVAAGETVRTKNCRFKRATTSSH